MCWQSLYFGNYGVQPFVEVFQIWGITCFFGHILRILTDITHFDRSRYFTSLLKWIFAENILICNVDILNNCLPFIQLRSGGFCKSAWINHQRDSSFVVISCSETVSTARPEDPFPCNQWQEDLAALASYQPPWCIQ